MRAHAATHDLCPVACELVADCDTPVSVLLRLGTGPDCFLLESVEGGERIARWSFLGRDPQATLTVRDGKLTSRRRDVPGEQVQPCADPLAALEAEIGTPRVAPVEGLDMPLLGGAVGYLSYEAATAFERLPVSADDPLALPQARFALYDTVVAFDHVAHRMVLVTHVRLDRDVDAEYAAALERLHDLRDRLRAPLPPAPLSELRHDIRGIDRESVANVSTPEFLESVARCKEHILAGDIYQVQISRRFSVPLEADPFALYRVLRSVNPSPYMFFLNTDECAVVGASPEMLVRVVDGEVSYRPIAGTRRRGGTPDRDRGMEAELRASEKERAEHLMLVDLGRNDLGRVCRTGSVEVTELMEVERFSHVMHLVSSIRGRLRADRTAVDALRACFPAGTVTGAPKLRAMEVIAEEERQQRGIYAGAVGYLDVRGNLDTAIALRTIVVRDGVAHVQAAAGVVADSVAAEEALEIDNKTAASLLAVERARQGWGG